MGLLDGKNVLVTGISTDDSLAFATASLAMQEGASVVLTSHGRVMSLCQRVRLESDEPVPLQLDGDPAGHLPVDIDVLPNRWTVVTPPPKLARSASEG